MEKPIKTVNIYQEDYDKLSVIAKENGFVNKDGKPNMRETVAFVMRKLSVVL